MRNKKILIIVIVFIVVLCITGGVLAYLFLATDAFKSDKEMFLEYFSQNIQMINNMKSAGTYEQIRNEETYESNIEIKVSNSKGGEISSPLNDLSMMINTKKDNINQYSYTNARVLFKEEQYLEAEVIQDQDISGIRFTDVVKQFVTTRDGDESGTIPTSVEDIVSEDGSHTVSSTVSPQVQVNLPEETPTPPVNTVDNTVANTIIPQTGTNNFPMIFIGIVAIVATIVGVRFYQLRKNVK